jgi:hypothetical protein
MFEILRDETLEAKGRHRRPGRNRQAANGRGRAAHPHRVLDRPGHVVDPEMLLTEREGRPRVRRTPSVSKMPPRPRWTAVDSGGLQGTRSAATALWHQSGWAARSCASARLSICCLKGSSPVAPVA